ncbi:helicase ARIP4-like [Elysia marginata]|uniref:Helicase ARIP4-like n=1 Tax=Elysia marginata TaxID=1093978 RepID=A0AAV4FI25_9GAST|nr:helicase ARIP4-like [Elysia marginata]
MDNIAELMDPGGIAEALSDNIPGLRNSPKSFLEEQEEKPGEVLKMVDSDILDLARQVGDEMEEDSQNASSADLSFLTDAVAKEADGEEDDPALSFLVGGGKMEVTNADLDFLDDDSQLNEAGSSEESDLYEDESEDDREEEDDDEESDTNSSEKDEKDAKKVDTEDQEDGVFGQVSFYDDDSTAMEKAKKVKPKKEKKKAKTKKKKRKVMEEGDEDEEEKPAKKKRRRKKKAISKEEGDEEGDEDVVNAGTTQMRRKNIRSILSAKDLDKDMLSAQNEELERQKRLMELKKSLLKENAAGLVAKAAAAAAGKMTSTAESSSSTSTSAVKSESSSKPVTASAGTSPPKEKDSQLKSLLQVAEEEAEKEAEVKAKKQLEISKAKKETRETSPPSDIITLSSDSDSSEEEEEDSDNAVMVSSDEEDELGDPEDVNNAGAHIDDSLNLPDEHGRVKVNVGHPSEDPDIFLAPQIAQAIKPHQIGGVRFLYDNILESLERFRTTPGFGCILAHSMGLGKTIQLISFIDIFIRCAHGKRVLCIVPINTLQNWMAEFNYWLPPPEKLHPDDNLTQSRVFPLYIINDNMKTTAARAAVIAKWKENGGALLIGYEMFRLLSSKKAAPSKAKSRSKKAEVIDVEEEDKNKSLMIDMHAMLVDPGPDLVMCDEGHRIKNSSAAISQALKTIKTRRRVVLTGYPLQNNLLEYWCMVDFVRPNFLGTKTEFSNMFERPIMNGQCMDSTGSDKKIMRHRSYVLHNLLEGFVQRRGHTVLQVNLPPKMEHVFLVRMSPIQRKIYVEFMNAITESGLCSWANNNPLKAFAVCCKIWNHPDILHEVLTKHIADKDNDLDIETGEGGANKKKKKPAGLAKSESSASIASTDSTSTAASTSTVDPTPPPITPSASTTSLTSMTSETSSEKNPITYDWAEPLMKEYVAGVVENSGKFVLMYGLIEECMAVGDKVLIFSQSLLTLNKIEEFLGRMRVPRMEINETWQRNRTYFRLDGSTSAQEREKLINQFNDPCGTAWIFLLSTKAGCLGINLVAANRVIVIDASWNPCHDCQAICRVYRFGQVKSSYVYRLITENTLERRIYDRQISKQGMSDRIVDDMNPENKLTRRQVENLLDFEDQEYPEPDFSQAGEKYGKDLVLVRVLQKYGNWLTKQPFTHESLLIDRKELRLSKREKRLAKEGYARDKRMNVNYTRPSYAAYYPQMGGALPNRLPMNSRYNYAAFRRGPIMRPIASVRPMIASNVGKGDGKIKQFGGQPLRPGVTIHQVITTTEIVLPGTNTSTPSGGSSNKISAGQKILVIKTPKGVYIRTNDGKMFAVRSKSGGGLGNVVAGAGSTGGAASTTTTTTLTSADGNRGMYHPVYGSFGVKP